MTAWTPRVAESLDSPEAAIRPLGWEASQEWCNFVVLRPESFAVDGAMLRPEAPPGRTGGAEDKGRPTWTISNRSGFRFEVKRGQTRLRVKQFLYDYAPPAFDHPSLWRSVVRGFDLGRHVAWMGKDFRGLPAASVHIERTMVEVSVVEGEATDQELLTLLRALRPAVPEARDRIARTSLGELSYQRRHVEPTISVPVGYWRYRRKPSSFLGAIYQGDGVPPGTLGSDLLAHIPPGFRLDTTLVFGSIEEPIDVDYVFRAVDDHGDYIRLLASPMGARDGFHFPLILDEQPCTSAIDEVRSVAVQHAFSDPALGQHEAVWQRGELTFMLLVKAAPGRDSAWFRNVFDELVRV